jgi:hypothetical protein
MLCYCLVVVCDMWLLWMEKKKVLRAVAKFVDNNTNGARNRRKGLEIA